MPFTGMKGYYCDESIFSVSVNNVIHDLSQVNFIIMV